MTREEAIRILDPATTREALADIEYYAGFNGHEAVIKAVEDACIMAIEALQERPKRQWVNGICTECGQVDFSEPNFCPNCGAEMER